MGLFIKNGEIITADSRYIADIWCENEQITSIGKNLEIPTDAQVIDASGKYVFPGFVDPHTHIYLPVMGIESKDNYETATIAALCGGTTTLIDFVIPPYEEEPLKYLEIWSNKAKGVACHDYSFHMTVSRYDAEVESQLREVVAGGISSFKVYLAYKDISAIDDYSLYNTLKLSKELGVLTAAHCENADLIVELQKELVAAGKLDPVYQYDSRPPLVEAAGTRHICNMAKLLGTHIYIVHVSCLEALREAVNARLQGANVLVETLIQFLLLDKSYTELPNFEGAKYVMAPPLREKWQQSILWSGLEQGLIATLATDHAPFDTKQKAMGRDNFTMIPNGLPGIEDRIRLLYTYGVQKGRLDINRFVEVTSTAPAKIFGMFPRKGTIQPGSDADLVIYDPKHKDVISAKTHHMNMDYNAYEGWEVEGRCAIVTVRGNIQVKNGKFVGKKGLGQFIKRKPNHFVKN